LHGRREGAPPMVDLKAELAAGGVIAGLIAGGAVSAVHDCSDGGLAVTVAEMALASGIGAVLDAEENAGFWFGEGQARYVVTTSDADAVLAAAKAAGVNATVIGSTGGDAIAFGAGTSVAIADLREKNLAFFKDWMEG
ncbi:MAG: AIR synthase-related protein, partial [Blastomonas sp.]|nr:AIR synthase-related protein [Blastomonas sp.]